VTTEFQGIFLIAGIAVLAPLLNRLRSLAFVPIVAIELILGMLVGPKGAGLVANDAVIEFLGKFGLIFLFFQAGFEFKHKEIGAGPLRLGLIAWLVSFGLAALVVALLYLAGVVRAPLLVAIVFPTTAFGVLLPILRQADELGTEFGRHVLGAAAIGELAPLLLASVALAKETHHIHQIFSSLLFLALALGSVFLLARLRSERMSQTILRWLADSEILPVRVAILLLLGFVSLADMFGMETVVGAYAAGMAVAMLVDGTEAEALEDRLLTIGAGFFVPVFFIASGVELDLTSLASTPANFARFMLFCAIFLLIRMAPLGLYRRALEPRDLPALALLSSTTLPLVVAITFLGAKRGLIEPENATALVGAAVMTVTAFPTLAFSIRATFARALPLGPFETAAVRLAEATAAQAERVTALARRGWRGER
jgi:Kef-type K+ transport system membrane component KefB